MQKVSRNPAIKIICPSSYNAVNTTKVQREFTENIIDCVPCSRGSHMLLRGTHLINYVDNINFDVRKWRNPNPLINQSTPIVGKCIDCPPGGNCTYGIKSQGNYFGQYIADTKGMSGGAGRVVEFMPCPPSYCCSNQGRPCVNVTSCNHNRFGKLCGSCHAGFYESYFSPICLDNTKCTGVHQKRFWIIFVATAFILTLIIFATKDFAVLLVSLFMFADKKFKRLKNKINGDSNKRELKLNRKQHETRIEYNNNRISNNCIVKKPAPRRFIFSAVLQITLSFFQIVSLLTIRNHSAERNKTMNRVISLFNLEVAVKEAEEICPFESADILQINFIKKIVFILTMLAFIFLFIFVFVVIRYCKSFREKIKNRKNDAVDQFTINGDKPNPSTSVEMSSPVGSSFSRNIYFKGLFRLSLLDKLILCYVKILMFGYKNISLFVIVSLNCVEVDGESVLYISGNVKCYQNWQWVVIVLLILWVIPFPMALVQAYRLYDTGFVNRFCYVACLIFPLLAFVLTIKYHGQKSRLLHEREGLQGALYDHFEEPYRIVQYHQAGDDNVQKTLYWWSAWRLYERLFIAMLVTFLIEPLFRMCVVAPVIVFLSILHYHIKPYKKTMPLLSLLDISSYIFLTFYVVDSMFRSFAYTFDLPIQNPIDKGIQFLNIFEAVLTPLTVIGLFGVTLVLEALYEITKTMSKKTE